MSSVGCALKICRPESKRKNRQAAHVSASAALGLSDDGRVPHYRALLASGEERHGSHSQICSFQRGGFRAPERAQRPDLRAIASLLLRHGIRPHCLVRLAHSVRFRGVGLHGIARFAHAVLLHAIGRHTIARLAHSVLRLGGSCNGCKRKRESKKKVARGRGHDIPPERDVTTRTSWPARTPMTPSSQQASTGDRLAIKKLIRKIGEPVTFPSGRRSSY